MPITARSLGLKKGDTASFTSSPQIMFDAYNRLNVSVSLTREVKSEDDDFTDVPKLLRRLSLIALKNNVMLPDLFKGCQTNSDVMSILKPLLKEVSTTNGQG